MGSNVFSLSKTAPDFQLGQTQAGNGSKVIQLPNIHPREALKRLAWAWELRQQSSETLDDVLARTPDLQQAAREVLSTVNQAAIFSKRPEILELIKKAREIEFPEIKKYIAEHNLTPNEDETILIVKQNQSIETISTEETCLERLEQADYAARIRKGFTNGPKFDIELIKIMELDGVKMQVNLFDLEEKGVRIDLRIHHPEGSKESQTTPVFQIFMDELNNIYEILMQPETLIPIPNGGYKLTYPIMLNCSENNLIVQGSGSGRRSNDPLMAALV